MNTSLQLRHPGTLVDRLTTCFMRTSVVEARRTYDLEDICYHLQVKSMSLPTNATAMEFLPILEHADQIGANAWASLADTPEGKLVLVDNPFMKVLLIRWEPGALSSRHGHPAGSGMIKVLDGAVQEELFMDEISNAPYSAHVHHESATSYIDDTLGLHTIGNPFEEAAVTLHAYLKYR